MKVILLIAIVTASIAGLTAQQAETEAPAHRECVGLECWNDGWCDKTWGCENGNEFSKNDMGNCEGNCGKDLWWNPDRGLVDGHLTGQCDDWDHLSDATKNSYLNDANCIPPCAWIASDDRCSASYVFRAPFSGSVDGRESNLECASGLVWSQDAHNCVYCEGVQNDNGGNCCAVRPQVRV